MEGGEEQPCSNTPIPIQYLVSYRAIPGTITWYRYLVPVGTSSLVWPVKVNDLVGPAGAGAGAPLSDLKSRHGW